MPIQNAIEVRNVTKGFRTRAIETMALRGVDFEVRSGEAVFLVGPSGSGKTTLLSIMGCLLRPSSGRVRIAGQDVTELTERKLPDVRLRNIGFVFQSFNLFPNLTAEENLRLALDLKGIAGSTARKRAAGLREAVGLEEVRSRFPSDLSRNQKQRVAIARALAADAPIILADEPTAALDFRNEASIMRLLCDLAHSRQRAVVVVTHDRRVMEYADRIVQIEDGRIADAPVLPPEPSAERLRRNYREVCI